MSKKCLDPRFEDMLHAYELGMLSEDDRQELEMHLIDCDSCFEEVSDFLPKARLLRHDPELWLTSKEQIKTGINITRLLVIAALVVITAIPVYRYGLMDDGTSDIVQQINLVPVRAGGDDTVSLEQGGRVEIRFYVEGATPESSYFVEIRSRDGDLLFSEAAFSQFNNAGAGLISLPVKQLENTSYKLTVSTADDDGLRMAAEYRFRAF